jgi:hypothetical protein
MAKASARDIAAGIVDILISDKLFAVEIIDKSSCLIIWSSATEELIEARIHEVVNEGTID